MNATTSTNLTEEFPNNHIDSNANHSTTIAATTLHSSSTLSLDLSVPATSQRPLVGIATTQTITANQECSRGDAQIELATKTLAGKEFGAAAYEDATKLISTAIKFININNNNSSNSNNTASGKERTNSHKYDGNSNKSTAQSTATNSVAKSASSKFINSRNKLTTAAHARQRKQQQQQQQEQEQIQKQKQEQKQQQQRQQTEQILSSTRDLNQINLNSSLYADQPPYNGNNNDNNNRNNNAQNDNIQNKLNINGSNNNESYINNNNNNNLNNTNDKNKKKQQQLKELSSETCATPNNNNNHNHNYKNKENDNSETIDSGHNNSDEKSQVNMSDNNSADESNELVNQRRQQRQQQQPISTTSTKASTPLKSATKVRAEKFAAMIKTPTSERAKGATLTLRKSLSTPASFKIGDVACASNDNKNNSHTGSKASNIKLHISARTTKQEQTKKELEEYVEENRKIMMCNKDDADDGGGGGGGGGDCFTDNNSRGKYTTTNAVATTVNLAAVTTKAKLANPSIEPTTTTAKPSARLDVVMRSQIVAHASQQQQLPRQHQHQSHPQQSNPKTMKAKNNNQQVICGNYSIVAAGEEDVVVVATTTTNATSSSLPLPAAVSFDLDLRFGCAHYKRRAMFVTPCCNKFYKCRFCHDENESHHFDRKTLTELICSECNMRQKVQEQCEACGTRFGKYTCLICNLFDDTDKKQYHCNGCGICRIGGAENFFHCEVCDMCLPIRLKIDGHRCVENISRSHCPVCLGDIHTSRIPCHIPDCGHLLHKTCFDQLLNSGHYTCPICQTSLIDMTALWEYLDAQAVSLPVPKKYENQRIHIFCNDCHKTSKTKFNFIGLKCLQCGAYNTTQDIKRRMSLVADEPSSA